MANIFGTSGDDTLPGTVDPDMIDGQGGNDSIDGDAGDDTLFGDGGNDTILGGADNDQLYGGDGDDSLDGGIGTDQVNGGAGNDTMVAHGGDSADGGAGNDTLTVRDGLGSFYDGGFDTDTLALDFALAAAGVSASLTTVWSGGSGSIGSATVSNFELISGPITGSAFDDSIAIGPNYSADLTMALGAGADSGTGGSGNDSLAGNDGNDELQGGAGNDTLVGGIGGDKLYGGSGNDTLSDTDGSLVVLNGDDGDDTVTLGGAMSGSANGGTGTDHLRFDLATAASGMTISLNATVGILSGFVGGVGIAGFETLNTVINQATQYNDSVTIGSGFAGAVTMRLLGGHDSYAGGAGNDWVYGGEGNDSLSGGAGTNTLIGEAGNDSYTVENATTSLVEVPGGGTDAVFASISWGLDTEFENLTLTGFADINGTGTVGANVLTGNNGANRLEGGFGNDTLNGANGNDQLYGGEGNDTVNGDGGNDSIADGDGTNTLNGGAGDDQIQFTGDAVNTSDGGVGTDLLTIWNFNRTTGYTIDLTAMWTGGSGSVNGGTVAGFEAVSIQGTQWGDVIDLGAGTTGEASISDAGAGDDILTGSNGNNYILGGDGNDTIVSGAGSDELDGGAGDDTFTISASMTGGVYGGAGTDTLGLVPAEPGALNIDLTALWSGGSGSVNGVAVSGIEVLQTNFIQSDHFVLSVADSVVIGAGYIGNLTMRVGRGADTVSGGSGHDIISGEQDDDVIRGGAGNDSVGGSYGSDYVYGDAGDDNVTGDTLDIEWASGNDHLYGGDGNDTIEAGAFQDWLYGEAGNDVLLGDSVALDPIEQGDDWLDGGAGNDQLFGHAGNDTLIGGTGVDAISGGAGNDVIYVDSASDTVTEGASEGSSDRIFSSVTYAMGAGVHVEKLTTTNNAGTTAINLTGNELGNLIYGNAGANVLDGKAGNDALTGLAGNDTLIGGAGNDTLAGGTGDDWYYVDSSSDVVVEVAGEGTGDRILTSVSFTLAAGIEIERLTTDNNAGTSAINLTGSAVGNLMYGNAGNNILDGRGGADTLIGFGGNDSYYIDNALDSVTEAVGEGADRIFASVSYTQGAGVQVETLTTTNNAGTGAINLTGNELANAIYGNAGANVLDGKGGNDALVGLGGADTFAFTTALGAGNIDTISGFVVADDTIRLENAVFTGLAAGALSAGAFNTGSAATQADDRIIYNSATGALLFDADGTGAAAAVQFATLTPGLALASADFLVV